MSFPSPAFPQTFDVGTPGAGHMHFAKDGSQTLYGPDGVTILATLDPTTGLTINKGSIVGVNYRTSALGARVEIDGSTAAKTVDLYAARVGDVGPGGLLVDSGTSAVFFQSIDRGSGRTYFELNPVGAAGGLWLLASSGVGDNVGTIQGQLLLQGLVAASVPLTVQGAALQSGDLTVWQTNAATILARLTAAGILVAKGVKTGAPVVAQPANGIASQGDISTDGAVNAASVAATGAISAASIAATGAVNAATVVATSKATAPNLAQYDDAVIVAVSVPAGTAPNGSQAFTWPKGLFTAAPIIGGATIVDPSGSSVGAGVRVSSVTSTGGTVLLHFTTTTAAVTVVNVHVRGYQQ